MASIFNRYPIQQRNQIGFPPRSSPKTNVISITCTDLEVDFELINVIGNYLKNGGNDTVTVSMEKKKTGGIILKIKGVSYFRTAPHETIEENERPL